MRVRTPAPPILNLATHTVDSLTPDTRACVAGCVAYGYRRLWSAGEIRILYIHMGSLGDVGQVYLFYPIIVPWAKRKTSLTERK